MFLTRKQNRVNLGGRYINRCVNTIDGNLTKNEFTINIIVFKIILSIFGLGIRHFIEQIAISVRYLCLINMYAHMVTGTWCYILKDAIIIFFKLQQKSPFEHESYLNTLTH